MSDMMTFPATVEEFMEQYKIVDDEKVYTNGADLVPIFRMMQWFEHVSATDKNVGTTDTISRQQAIDALKNDMASLDHIIKGMSAYDVRLDAYVSQRNQVNCDIDTINNLPPAQPEIIRCKDCEWCKDADGLMCKNPASWVVATDRDFGCVLAERRTDG